MTDELIAFILISMPTLLFVHGTGVRGESYFRCLDLVCRKAKRYLKEWSVQGCQWGDPFGARFNHQGQSIPGYDESGNSTPAFEGSERARWYLLAEDPLLELRLLPEQQVIGETPGEWLWQQLRILAHDSKITMLLKPWEISELWSPFVSSIAKNEEWESVVKSVAQPKAAASDKIARAVVAGFQMRLRDDAYPAITGDQRDSLKDVLVNHFGGPPLGVGDWFLKRLTNFAVPRRGRLSDASSPAVGDILRYQARGIEIRNFIHETIVKSSAIGILSHSLGGIASVDLLASTPTPIQYLITVGSQVPYFYEIDALVSRSFGSGLPKEFPRNWLNILDPRDFLSYRAETIFPGAVQDKWVDNDQPFPESHSAYWNNDKVWEEIGSFLPE